MDKVDPRCACAHHQVVPVAIVLIGLDFLANALGLVPDALLAMTWPVLLVVAGVAKLAGPGCHCCSH